MAGCSEGRDRSFLFYCIRINTKYDFLAPNQLLILLFGSPSVITKCEAYLLLLCMSEAYVPLLAKGV
jgi:hypothetical protein